MEKIQECAHNFLHLVSTTKYVFHVAKRGVKVLILDFELKDFHHLAGLKYLDDINIPKDKKKTIDWILSEQSPITDAYLASSKHYKGKVSDEKNVEERISEFRYIEQYLDVDNFIRIYSPKDGPQNNSMIRCDYIIESKLKHSNKVVYIFIKHRKGLESPCCIVSFGVKKNTAYGGQNLYWMLKDKIVSGNRITIY
ncbi:MAG: hypothetical protein J6A11_05035 [Lachnospiraceae bacterium]|nr:hypothetical protein [Lachnospiraceae bacterium]